MTCQQAVIFDLDDTLFAEMDFVASGFRAVAKWLETRVDRHHDVIVQEFRELQLVSSEMVFNRWLDEQSGDVASVSEMIAVYRSHIPEVKAYPFVVPLLESLRSRYRLGLVSDGYLQTQQNKWNALGLDSRFDAVVFSDELGRENWKPSPAPFQRVLGSLSVVPARSVYVGDNPKKDFVGARRVGMKAIRIRHKWGVYSKLEPVDQEHQPDIEVDDHSKLQCAIEQLVPSE